MTKSAPCKVSAGIEQALTDALVQTSFSVVDAVSAVAARHDMSLTLLRVVAILRDRTPRMSELADHLGLDRSSITGLVDRAVARGLMCKISDDQDRRSSRVALTSTGQSLAESCAIEVSQGLDPISSRITATQREHLTRLLAALGSVS